MLTLLHVIGGLNGLGGTPRKLLYLVKHLDASQCREVFLCYQPSPLKAELERHGAIVECLDGGSPAAIVRHAVRLARTQRADAICTHFTRPLVTGYLAALAAGVPQIHNQHSSAEYIRGFGRTLTRIVLPRVRTVVCNSHHTLASLRREYALPPERLIVLHDPVEARVPTVPREDFRRGMGMTGDALLIGHVGGMIPERDQGTLIQAFARLRAEHPRARLVLIGDGPLRGELESLADRLDLGSSVAFPGYSENVGDYLHAMDIYVNPTLDEGFGIAVAEAMLARLPVALSNRGAHPELVRDGASGMLFEGGNGDSLAKVLDLLAREPSLRRRLGETAFARASAMCHPKVYAEAYLDHARRAVATDRIPPCRSAAG